MVDKCTHPKHSHIIKNEHTDTCVDWAYWNEKNEPWKQDEMSFTGKVCKSCVHLHYEVE